MQVSAPARRLLSWRHKIEAKAVDIYFGRRRVIHANNWLVKVQSLFMTGSCLVHHAAARGMHDTLLERILSLLISSLSAACNLHSNEHSPSVSAGRMLLHPAASLAAAPS